MPSQAHPQRAAALAFALMLLAGCAGRAANPVMVYQHGDESRSCAVLEQELDRIEDDILALMPQTDKSSKNTSLGVAGMFLLFPLFFMDISKSEQVEVNALIKRYNHLLDVGEANQCGFERQRLPDFQKTDY